MSWIRALEIWLQIFVIDLLRYLIPAGLAFALLWAWGARGWAKQRRLQARGPGAARIGLEIAASLSTVVVFSVVGLAAYAAIRAGHTLVYSDFASYGRAYAIASFAAIVVLHDAYFYWTHRLLHLPCVYERVHRVHHLSTTPTPWAAYAFHPLEALLQAGIYPLIVLTIPAHPATLFAFLTFMILRNVQGHLGYEFLPRWFTTVPLARWLTSTTHHDLHHRYFQGNYGLYFTWWDDLSRTTRPDYLERFAEITSPRLDVGRAAPAGRAA